MRITVVGGSGFIGTHLLRALRAAGHDLRVFDRLPPAQDDVEHVIGDVRDATAVAAALRERDAVIDLAAEHRDDVRPVSRYFDVNVGGARNLAAAAERHGVPRLLFISSAAVYGPTQPGASETSPLQPETPYGQSKAQAEAIYRAWQAGDPARRALCVVRPSIVYGEGHHGNMRVLIDHLRRRRFVLVDGGRNRKSVAYVGNLVAFLAGVIDTAPGVQVYNYADPEAPRVGDLAREILALMPGALPAIPSVPAPLALAGAWLAQGWATLRGAPGSITPRRVRTLCTDTTLDVSALQRAGFRPPFTRAEGLSRTVGHDGGD